MAVPDDLDPAMAAPALGLVHRLREPVEPDAAGPVVPRGEDVRQGHRPEPRPGRGARLAVVGVHVHADHADGEPGRQVAVGVGLQPGLHVRSGRHGAVVPGPALRGLGLLSSGERERAPPGREHLPGVDGQGLAQRLGAHADPSAFAGCRATQSRRRPRVASCSASRAACWAASNSDGVMTPAASARAQQRLLGAVPHHAPGGRPCAAHGTARTILMTVCDLARDLAMLWRSSPDFSAGRLRSGLRVIGHRDRRWPTGGEPE